MLVLLLAGGAGAATITVNASGGADYTRIQDAVNAVGNGDTILVAAGTYNENVDVTKSINIIGAGAEITTVKAYNPNASVFHITANYANISGFTITGSTGGYYSGIYGFKAGIYIDHAFYANISNNNASNNSIGIFVNDYPNAYIINNTATNNYFAGIWLYYAENNIILNNTVNSNKEMGIRLDDSMNNVISNNVANSNLLTGIWIFGSGRNIITNNTAEENGNEDYEVVSQINWDNTACSNTLENNTGSGDRPVKHFNHSVNLQNETFSELILCNADNSIINNITIEGSATKKNNGLYLIFTGNSHFTNINS